MVSYLSLPPTEIFKLIDFWTTYLDKHEPTTAPDYRVAVRSTLMVLELISTILSKSEESRRLWSLLISNKPPKNAGQNTG